MLSALLLILAWILWALPGVALTRICGCADKRDPLGFAAATLFLSTAVSTLAAFLLTLAGLSMSILPWLLTGLGLLGALGLGLRPAASTLNGTPSRLWQRVGWLGLAAVVALGLGQGGTLAWPTDAPDHVGTLREILATGLAFPTEAFHLGAGAEGFDPRKGLLHPVYAAMADFAGLDPVDFWLLIPGLSALFPVLGAYGFLRWTGATAGVATIGAALALLTWSGGPGDGYVPYSAYPNQIGAACFWALMGFWIHLAGKPHRRLLIAAPLLLWCPVAVHPMYTVFVALFAPVLVLAVVVCRRASVRPLLVAALGGAVLVGPYLAYRLSQFAPANPIHEEIQGMLLLGDRFIASPSRLWPAVGLLGLIAYPVAAWLAASRLKQSLHAWVILTAALLFPLLAFNPILVPILQERLTYLIFRAPWFLPPFLATGAALAWLAASPRRGGRVLAGLLLAVGLVPGLATVPHWFERVHARAGVDDPLRMRDAFDALEAALPPRSVVLADPVTAYMIPAFTSHRVVAGLDQHTSPNDSRAEERIQRAREALSPVTDIRRSWSLCREAGAAALVTNRALPRHPRSSYWEPRPEHVEAKQVRLDASDCFETLFVRDDLSAFRPGSACENSGIAYRLLLLPLLAFAGPDPLLTHPDGLQLLRGRVTPTTVTCGESVRLILAWGTVHSLEGARNFTASVRLDRVDLPGGEARGGKIARKLTEALRRESYRTRVDWTPAAGILPPERWPPEKVLGDTLRVVPPCGLAPGTYTVSVALNRFPHMPNLGVRDYLDNRDLYSGVVVDTLRVVGSN